MELADAALTKILETIQQAEDEETGGILLGYYTRSHATARVMAVTGPPVDSKKGRSWFYRGMAGLRQLLEALWPQKVYYLGEWHLHPRALPTPSEDDKTEMFTISRTTSYQCPEPILLIIGGSVEAYSIRTFVFVNGKVTELMLL